MVNKGKQKNSLKRAIDNGDDTTRTLCLGTNKLTVKRWLGKSMRTVNLKQMKMFK